MMMRNNALDANPLQNINYNRRRPLNNLNNNMAENVGNANVRLPEVQPNNINLPEGTINFAEIAQMAERILNQHLQDIHNIIINTLNVNIGLISTYQKAVRIKNLAMNVVREIRRLKNILFKDIFEIIQDQREYNNIINKINMLFNTNQDINTMDTRDRIKFVNYRQKIIKILNRVNIKFDALRTFDKNLENRVLSYPLEEEEGDSKKKHVFQRFMNVLNVEENELGELFATRFANLREKFNTENQKKLGSLNTMINTLRESIRQPISNQPDLNINNNANNNDLMEIVFYDNENEEAQRAIRITEQVLEHTPYNLHETFINTLVERINTWVNDHEDIPQLNIRRDILPLFTAENNINPNFAIHPDLARVVIRYFSLERSITPIIIGRIPYLFYSAILLGRRDIENLLIYQYFIIKIDNKFALIDVNKKKIYVPNTQEFKYFKLTENTLPPEQQLQLRQQQEQLNQGGGDQEGEGGGGDNPPAVADIQIQREEVTPEEINNLVRLINEANFNDQLENLVDYLYENNIIINKKFPFPDIANQNEYGLYTREYFDIIDQNNANYRFITTELGSFLATFMLLNQVTTAPNVFRLNELPTPTIFLQYFLIQLLLGGSRILSNNEIYRAPGYEPVNAPDDRRILPFLRTFRVLRGRRMPELRFNVRNRRDQYVER